PPFAFGSKAGDRVSQNAGRAQAFGEGRRIEHGRPLRFELRVFTAEKRIELRPARLDHAKISMSFGECQKRLCRGRTLRAIQIEPTAHTEMPALVTAFADVEAVEDLDFEARKEIRHPITGHEHRVRTPAAHLRYCLQALLVLSQEARKPGFLDEPGCLVTARANRSLQRT